MADPTGRSFWRRILDILDDALPMSPVERSRRDDDGRDHSEDRKRRLRLHLLEKRTRGSGR